MTERLWLGAVVGTIVSVVSWNGNRTPHTVSPFPDGVTFVILAALMGVAMWFHFRHSRLPTRAAGLAAGGAIAAATGVVFGAAVVVLGVMRFSHPAPPLMVFGFLTTFASSLVVGLAAAALVWSPRFQGGAS